MIHFKIGALRLTGRLLMASMFLVAGLARIASTHVVTAGHVASDGPPMDNMVAVFLGSFEVAAACTLALDLKTRWVALGLAAYLLVTNFIFHQFWSVEPQYQFAQQLLFMKGLTVIGALLVLAGVDDAFDPA
jgi:putative oxidoreductase